jgi:hypothetical protein
MMRLLEAGVITGPQPDKVMGFGPKVAPTTWSHEFRHRATQPDSEEEMNRIRDAYYANSLKAWNSALEGWHDWHKRDNSKATPEMSKELLLRILKRRTYNSPQYGPELQKNFEAGGPQPATLDRVLATLGFPSEKFNNQVAVNAPWTIWAEKESEVKNQ